MVKRFGWKGGIKRNGKTNKGMKKHLVMMELIQAELSSGFLKGTRTKLESTSCGEILMPVRRLIQLLMLLIQMLMLMLILMRILMLITPVACSLSQVLVDPC